MEDHFPLCHPTIDFSLSPSEDSPKLHFTVLTLTPNKPRRHYVRLFTDNGPMSGYISDSKLWGYYYCRRTYVRMENDEKMLIWQFWKFRIRELLITEFLIKKRRENCGFILGIHSIHYLPKKSKINCFFFPHTYYLRSNLLMYL